jgi:hypothetical protein
MDRYAPPLRTMKGVLLLRYLKKSPAAPAGEGLAPPSRVRTHELFRAG